MNITLTCPHCHHTGYKFLASGSNLAAYNPRFECPDCGCWFYLYPLPPLPPSPVYGLQFCFAGKAVGGKQIKMKGLHA